MNTAASHGRVQLPPASAPQPASAMPQPAPLDLPRACLWLGLLYLATALLSLVLSRQPGSIANIWYANAVAVAFFVRAPRAQWLPLALTIAVANPLANLMWGDGVAAGLSFLPANLVEILLAAWLLQRLGLAATEELTAHRVWRWMLFGGLLPQLAGATTGALTVSWHGGDDLANVWLTWYEGAALGALSLLPLALFVADRGVLQTLQALRDRRLAVFVPLTVGVTLMAAAALPYPFVYVMLPLLAAAALVHFAAVMVLTALASVTLAAAIGLGVLVPPPTTAAWQDVFSYLAFAGALVPAQLLAAMTHDLRSSRARLVERGAELSQAREAAEAASRAKSAFLAMMSHDIRTPMNGVLGTAEVLARSPLTPQQADDVQTIRGSALSLLALLDEVLDFSRIEAGRVELHRAPVELAPMAEAVCESLLPVALERGVDTLLYVDPALPPRVWGDATRLRQVLSNLLGNAIKFSAGRPGQPGRVAVRLERADGADCPRLLVRVRDNGIGIDPAAIPRLFEPFEQAGPETARRFAGSGLGLAIVKQVVAQMGGEVTVRSAPGAGSSFEVTLPLEPAGDSPTPPARLDGIEAIVVGDDERAAVVRTYLQGSGARVLRCADEAAALQAATGSACPVVLQLASDHPAQAGASPPWPRPVHAGLVRVLTGRRRRLRPTGPRTVELDGHCLVQAPLLEAVALAADRLALASPARAEGAAAPAATPWHGASVLVAEDDPVNCLVITRQLELLGLQATVASDGRQALQIWLEGRFALLLTDLQMPGLDGFGLTQAIREHEAARGPASGGRLPILALTANAFDEVRERALAAGVDGYLTKPLLLDALRHALERWLPHDTAPRG
jgi:signal transduction histidine kinase/CheY-like chemotaxis protein